MREHAGFVAVITGCLVALGAGLIAVGAVIAQGGTPGHLDLWGNAWFVLGICFICLSAVGIVTPCIMYVRKPREGRKLGVGLAELIPTAPEPDGPLQITLEQEKWDDWQRIAWIAELKFRITNTSGQLITLARFNLESDPGPVERPPLGNDVLLAIFHEIGRRRDARRSLYLRSMDLEDGDSVSGWWVQDAYLPLPARAGRPRCVFTVTDGVGDTYELEIPPREPQVRRIEGEP